MCVVRCMQGVVTAVSVVLEDCSLKLHACHHAIILMISDGGGGVKHDHMHRYFV